MILEFKNVTKSFGDKKVLRGISFKAESGKTFGLLGRNGAGKTTAIRILMNVFPCDGGEITIDGKPINYSEIKLGYLPEERGLYPRKKILEQLVYFAMLKGMDKKSAAAAAEFWLKKLDMYAYADKRLNTLSKGNQQKIQLITALCHDPAVIILDEPFSGLDPVNAATMKDVIKEQIALGKTVLFSSHQMSYIEEFCDSIAILNAGEIALYGDLREIKRNYPRNRLVISSENPEPIIRDFGESCVMNGKNSVTVKLKDPSEKQSVMRRIAENYDVDEVKVFEPSLNDIFVEYAGERE